MDKGTRDLKYFNHYAKHTRYVTLAWKTICEELWNRGMLTEKEFEETSKHIIWHDQSKMDKSEWNAYADRFYGDKDDEEVKSRFKAAVLEHKAKNLHHFESLKNYKGDDWRCYIIELVCDYIAMGWEFDNYILEYYDSVRGKIELPSEYKAYLESVLNMLREPQLFEIVERPLTNDRIVQLEGKEILLKS